MAPTSQTLDFQQQEIAERLAAANERTAAVCSMIQLGGKVLTGWVGREFVAGINRLPFPKFYRQERTHQPGAQIKDATGKTYVVWHDGSLRRTDKVALRFVQTHVDRATKSPDPQVRAQSERTLMALRKDLDSHRTSQSAEEAAAVQALEEVAA